MLVGPARNIYQKIAELSYLFMPRSSTLALLGHSAQIVADAPCRLPAPRRSQKNRTDCVKITSVIQVAVMAKKKKQTTTKQIVNRRARHDYELGDSLVVGISLTGGETKALRMGHGQLRGAYVNVKDGELWLMNATINGTRGVVIDEQTQVRNRKLLAKRREIEQLIEAKQQGRTIVPLEILTGGRFIKLRIAIGRGKKLYDKREALKKRDESRTIARAVSRYVS
jgi:SsrA-binding protein